MNTKRCIEWFLLPVVIITAISSCQPTSTPTPTEKPSPTPTEQPSPTPTDQLSPSPTATEDPCGQMPPSELGGTWESQPPLIPTGPVPEGAVLRLGKGRVYAIAAAPDGKTIAIATVTGLTMFSIPDLQELWSVSYLTYPVVGRWRWVEADHLQFSQDGSILKAIKETEDLYFDAQDGTILEPDMVPDDQSFPDPEPVRSQCILEEYEGEIFHQAISADGAFAAGSEAYSGSIRVFDNCTCRLLNEFDIGGMGKYLAWLPARPGECGGALLTVTGLVGIWDPWSGEQIRAGALGMGSQLAWSPDGSILAVGADTLVVLVDVDTMAVADVLGGDRIPRLKPISFNNGYIEAITSINWDSNAQLVVAGHNGFVDATVMTWTQQTGAAWYDLPGTGRKFAPSPDGQLLASTDFFDVHNRYAFRLWEVHSGALLRTVEPEHPQSCRGLVWSPDGTRLVCTSQEQTVVFDANTGQPVSVMPQYLSYRLDTPRPQAAWSPDGAYLAINPWLEGYTIVWDIEHDEHYMVEGLDYPSWSPDGLRIAGAGADNTVVIWDLQQRALTHTLACYDKWDYSMPYVVAWSPDGTLLASGSSDLSITIFDVAEERMVKRLEGHALHLRGVDNVAWSPDGRLLASVAGDRTLIIWDVSQIGQ